MARKKVRRGPAVAFVSKVRVRRFLVAEKLALSRKPVPAGFWQKLDAGVQAQIREEFSRGQISLPL